jgi:hypothetical protein
MATQPTKLIDCFQKAFQVGTIERDPERYLARYRSQIQAAGRVFQYLELAKPDSRSVLGWKPTKRLLDLIAKSNAGPSKTKPESVEVQVLLDLMVDTILGSERRPSLVRFCMHSLIRLGLVVEDPVGDEVPKHMDQHEPRYVREGDALRKIHIQPIHEPTAKTPVGYGFKALEWRIPDTDRIFIRPRAVSELPVGEGHQKEAKHIDAQEPVGCKRHGRVITVPRTSPIHRF